MQQDKRMLPAFAQKIKESAGMPARPDHFGYSRAARQLHQVETAVVWLTRVMSKGGKFPLPPTPITPAEFLQQQQEQDEFDKTFADIYMANPSVFGNSKKN